MNGKRILGLALIIGGAVALYFGYQATESPLEMASEAVSGKYTDETMAYLIGGGVSAVVGLGLLLFGKS